MPVLFTEQLPMSALCIVVCTLHLAHQQNAIPCTVFFNQQLIKHPYFCLSQLAVSTVHSPWLIHQLSPMSAKPKLCNPASVWASSYRQAAHPWLIYWHFNNIIIWNQLIANKTAMIRSLFYNPPRLSSPLHSPAPHWQTGSWRLCSLYKAHRKQNSRRTRLRRWPHCCSPVPQPQTGNKVPRGWIPMSPARWNWPEKEWTRAHFSQNFTKPSA